MSRVEREEFVRAAERLHEPENSRRVMTGTDATRWMASQTEGG